MGLSPLVAFSLLVLFSPAALQAGDPPTRTHLSSDSAFRIKVTEEQRGVRIEIENLEPFPITATLTIGELENLAADQTLPRVEVLPAKGKCQFVRLTPKDRKLGWRYGRVRCTYQIGSIKVRPKPYDYELPFPHGAAYRVDQAFNGAFSHEGRNALDFALEEGDPVSAARGGRVVKVESHHKEGGAEARFRGKANRVWILHSDGTFGCYAHFKHGGVSVKLGQEVRTGDAIGQAGATGFAQGPHLHFEVRYASAGRRQAATIPITFRTPDGVRQSLAVGKTYRRAAAVAPRLRVELCRAPTRDGVAVKSAPRGVKLWARLSIGGRTKGQLSLVLRRAGSEKPAWNDALPLQESADQVLHALPSALAAGRYELIVRREEETLARLAFTIE